MKTDNKAFVKGCLFGISLICVLVWFVHRFGFVHVYFDKTNLKAFSQFENERTGLTSTIDNSIEGLEIIRTELEKVINTGVAPFTINPKQRFQSLKAEWPELHAKVAHLAPSDGAYIFLVQDGEYKALIASQLCVYVSLDYPNYIDKIRTNYDFTCHYYGVWSDMGKKL